jgi:hypothetical protein
MSITKVSRLNLKKPYMFYSVLHTENVKLFREAVIAASYYCTVYLEIVVQLLYTRKWKFYKSVHCAGYSIFFLTLFYTLDNFGSLHLYYFNLYLGVASFRISRVFPTRSCGGHYFCICYFTQVP